MPPEPVFRSQLIRSGFFLPALLVLFLSLPGKQRIGNDRERHSAYIREISESLKDIPVDPYQARLTYPYQAALQEYIQTMDPSTRKVPLHRRFVAAEQALRMMGDTELKSGSSSLEWKSLPANTGGRARALMFDPNDPEHKKVWAGTGWGIMYSGDAGESWKVLESTRGFAYITDIRIRDENGKSVIYCGTKSGEYKGKIFESEPDNGLYRSVDGGESWTQVLPLIHGKNYTWSVSDIEISAPGQPIQLCRRV